MPLEKARRLLLLPSVSFGIVAALPAQPRSDAPEYLVRTVTTMTSAGWDATTYVSVFTGKRDGSRAVRTIETRNQRPCTTTTQWDVSSRREVWSSDCIELKSEFPFDRIPHHAARLPQSTCASSERPLKSVEKIDGLTVEKFETDDERARSALYLAPSLGCLKIRAAHHWKNRAGEIFSSTVDEPVEIRLDSHDASLFVLPRNYREVVPSERWSALCQYFTGQVDGAECVRAGPTEDRKYATANAVSR